MPDSPVEQVESVAETSQTSDETIKEYVVRVGEEHDADQPLIEEALSYVTEYYYSAGLPEDSSGFEAFLAAVGDPSDLPGTETLPEASSGSGATDAAGEDGPVVQPPEPGASTGASRFKSGIRGKEPRMLVLRFLVIVVTAPVVGWMFARAWVPGNAVYDRGRELLTQILGLPALESTKLFVLFGFGLYLGLLTLFTIDVKKRVQAVLLWLGTVLVIVAVAAAGWVIPRVTLTTLNVLGFVIGFVAGTVVELDQLRRIDIGASSFRRPTLSSGELPEFRYAAGLLFTLLALVVTATLVQVGLAGTMRLFDPVLTAVFLAVAFQFVGYESETSYVTLGPERSGKSMLMLGLCLTLLRNDEMHPDPNSYLQNSLERASNLQPDQETWPIPSTAYDELQTASFEVIAGYYFPRRLELTALDYAGQYLETIADLTGTPERDTGTDDGIPAKVVDWVASADTLLFILDVERLVYPEEFHEGGGDDGAISWGLEHYTTIVDGVDPDETIVVATKCDILIDRGRVDPPQSYDSHSEFRSAVTDHLAARPDVEELLATTGEATIHPLYFVTERRDGAYVPYLDEDDNLVPVGYDRLIEEMRARQ
jgi:hypothetical protein